MFNELKKQTSWLEESYDFYFYRDKDQYEVDFLIENEKGIFIGIEVKSGATINSRDFNGLKKINSILGEKLVRGILLYDGEHILPMGNKFIAAPISLLWS